MGSLFRYGSDFSARLAQHSVCPVALSQQVNPSHFNPQVKPARGHSGEEFSFAARRTGQIPDRTAPNEHCSRVRSNEQDWKMTFSIRAWKSEDPAMAGGEIRLDDHKETFPLVTTYWSCDEYRCQWMEALSALTDDLVNSCLLITDVQPLSDSTAAFYWVLFRDQEVVYVQERFTRNRESMALMPATAVEKHIEPRFLSDSEEEQARISEWTVSFEDVLSFVRSRETDKCKGV